jgi:cytochrome c oxidase subunit 4
MTPEEVKHHIKTYVLVFVALACLTVITVGISYLDLATGPAIILALIVASIKGSLVACYFMHLIDEKVTIYWTLLATVAMFMVLMFLPLGTMLNNTQM